MFFVFYAPTNEELCKADAIACNYLESILKEPSQLKVWQFSDFVINSPIAKLSEFWINNADNLEEAIAKERYAKKAIDQLTAQDYSAMRSCSNFKSHYANLEFKKVMRQAQIKAESV